MKKTIILVVTIFVIAVAILNCIIEIYDFVAYKKLMRLLLAMGVLIFIIGVALLILRKTKSILIIALTLTFSLIISNIISTAVINYQRQEVFANGIRIVEALDKYYKINKEYPKHLNELVPKYIESIPTVSPSYDKGEFSYFVQSSGQSYHLGFEQYYYDGKGWVQE